MRERHDARKELERWFGFSDFRPEPVDADGRPLQQVIVEEAMRGEHVLGILPTGTGKSVCYQIPALSRYDKTGALTVVISPLVALMADQVSGLAAARASALRGRQRPAVDARTRRCAGPGADGRRGRSCSISPEQLRSRAVRKVLAQREIGPGCWTRRIASRNGATISGPTTAMSAASSRNARAMQPVPPVLCLTATAKPDVVRDIR